MNDEQWVIWNGFFGVRDFVYIGEIENTSAGHQAWLEAPYEMVGPFSLDDLITTGLISFAECMVMSYQYWADNHQALRLQALSRQRAAQDRYRTHSRHKQQNKQPPQFEKHNEQYYRQTLKLPMDGELSPVVIKTAYRRLAQKAHPDVGGTQQRFIEITAARNALLARF